MIGRFCSFTKSFQTFLEFVTVNDLPRSLPLMRIGIRTILAHSFSTKKSLAEKTGKSFKITETEEGQLVKKKLFSSPKILLVDESGNKKSMYLEQAQKLARHDGLELIQLESTTLKPLYKLTKTSKIEETLSKEKNVKSKRFILKTRMLENDINSKIKQMLKLLDKGNSVNIQIFPQEGSADKLDEILEKLKKEIGSKHDLNVKSASKSAAIIKVSPIISNTEEKENAAEKTS